MIAHDYFPQGSEQWFAARRGRPTASNFDRIVTAKKGDYSTSAAGYIAELIGECFCPEWVDFEGNRHTDRGTELEPEARAAFIAATGAEVAQVGFCTRDDGIVGCSPDGLLVGADGHYSAGLEIKCPAPKTHVSYIMGGVLPDDYKQQVHGGMAVTGLKEWHFFSYFPGLQAFHLVVQRDDYTDRMSTHLDRFLKEYGAARSATIPKLRLPAAA